jgi:glutathione synthase/RimK-type ligase-like ATP-grasp enzyme
VVSILRDRSIDVVHVDESALATLRYDVSLGVTATGWIETQHATLRVDDLTGIYLRPRETPPELTTAASMTLLGIAACAPAIVVNRPSAGRSNWSKPFQLRLIAAAGLKVPDTLVTTYAEAALSFLVEHKRIVYKSISGVRSIVASLTLAGADRLRAVAHGPVQFQQWIDGRDIRVHVIDDRWFATAIDSDVDDYRYASRDGADITMTPVEIPIELGNSLVALTKKLGLLVSGIDLRVTRNDEWFCFEVNPSPGFTFYEAATGQPIGDAIADLLVSGAKSRTRRPRKGP